jgi:hypothetical protein
VGADAPFPFVQFEFGFPLGPDDGRYLRRAREGGAPQRVIVLGTLGAPQRRLLRGRKPAAVEAAGPAPVPTARATLIRPEPFESAEGGERWLERLRGDEAGLDAEVDDALGELNSVLRTHRAAAADPYVREVSRAVANVVRVGYGSGERVADGRFAAAYELPEGSKRARRAEAMTPLERLAAVLSGAEEVGVAEELVLRARLDLDSGRPREAALQARIALEALLAERAAGQAALATQAEADDAGAALEAQRAGVAEAANAALRGELDGPQLAAVTDAVLEMRRALRRTSGR